MIISKQDSSSIRKWEDSRNLLIKERSIKIRSRVFRGSAFGYTIKNRIHELEMPRNQKQSQLLCARNYPQNNYKETIFDLMSILGLLNSRSKTPMKSDNKTAFERDKMEYERHRLKLVHDAKHLNKFIAIIDGKLVKEGDDKIKLATELYKQYGDKPMYIGKVSDKMEIAEDPSAEIVRE